MGVGKSIIGCLFVKELYFVFKDFDKEIEQWCGVNILWIFDVEGEVGFCECEQVMFIEFCVVDGMVIVIGGGVVMCDGNCQVLCVGGWVVYLYVLVEYQIVCMVWDCNCFLLQKFNLGQIFCDLMVLCDLFYCEIVDVVVEIDERLLCLVVQEIFECLCKLLFC